MDYGKFPREALQTGGPNDNERSDVGSSALICRHCADLVEGIEAMKKLSDYATRQGNDWLRSAAHDWSVQLAAQMSECAERRRHIKQITNS